MNFKKVRCTQCGAMIPPEEAKQHNGLCSLCSIKLSWQGWGDAKSQVVTKRKETKVKKVPCVRCGAMILPETAKTYAGLCVPCASGSREQIPVVQPLGAKIYPNEQRLLHRLLNEAGLKYTIIEDFVVIPFTLSGSEVVEEESEIQLLGCAGDGYVCIGIKLLDLDENAQYGLDPALLVALLRANYEIIICKFGFDSDGLWLTVDFEAKNLQAEELRSGIDWLLIGFESYLKILSNWFEYIQETEGLHPQDFERNEEYYQTPADKWADPNTTKGLVLRSLLGVAKYSLKAAVLAGITAILGMPPTAIAGILGAVGRGENGMDS